MVLSVMAVAMSFGCWEQIDDGAWFPQMKRQIPVQAFELNTHAGQRQGFSPPQGTVPITWGDVPDLASLAMAAALYFAASHAAPLLAGSLVVKLAALVALVIGGAAIYGAAVLTLRAATLGDVRNALRRGP